MRALRWWPYLILVLALVGCLVAFVRLPLALEGWRGFFLNLAMEIVGILLVVWLIDAVLRRREERARERYRSVALRLLRSPLNRAAHLLFNIYKASVARRPERTISRVSDLFDEDYFRQSAMLDITAASYMAHPHSIWNGETMPWYECINTELDGFAEDLGRVIDKYAMYLDFDTIDAAERLIHSDFANIARVGPILATHSRNTGYQGPVPLLAEPGTQSPIREYVDAFSELVDIYNRGAPDDRKIYIDDSLWRDDILPKMGSARIPDEIMRRATDALRARKERDDPHETGQRD